MKRREFIQCSGAGIGASLAALSVSVAAGGPPPTSSGRPERAEGRSPAFMTRLILFDIEGTLVLTGGAGQRAIVRAFAGEFGVGNALGDIPLAGRTDRAILEDVLERFAPGAAHEPERLQRLVRRYLEYLETEMAVDAPGKLVLPGVREVLSR